MESTEFVADFVTTAGAVGTRTRTENNTAQPVAGL